VENYEIYFLVVYAIIFAFIAIFTWFLSKKEIELKIKKGEITIDKAENLILKFKRKIKITSILFIGFLFIRLFVSISNLIIGERSYLSEYLDVLMYPVVLVFAFYIIRFRCLAYCSERFLVEKSKD
jgi:hypothetical protein